MYYRRFRGVIQTFHNKKDVYSDKPAVKKGHSGVRSQNQNDGYSSEALNAWVIRQLLDVLTQGASLQVSWLRFNFAWKVRPIGSCCHWCIPLTLTH